SYPYIQDFESGPDFWESEGINNSWAFGTPDKDVINSANSGDSAWVTGGLGLGAHSPNERSFVVGPCFDFSNVSNPEIRMAVWYESEFSVDGAALQSSIDNGQTWQLVGSLASGINWYNDNTISGGPGGQQIGWTGRTNSGNGSGGWLFTQNALTGLGGQPQVRLRVAFGANGFQQDDGFAFDDIIIFDRNDVDLGAASISAFPASVCLGDSTELTLTLTNYGNIAQSNVPVQILVNGPVNDTLNGVFQSSITPNDTLSYFFGNFGPSQAGTYELTAYTVQNGDTTFFHDTATVSILASTVSPAPTVEGDTLCSAGNAVLTLTADSSGAANIIWTNALNGGRVIARGDTVQTPAINSSTIFYAQGATLTSDEVGPNSNTFGLGSHTTLFNSGLQFDVLQNMILKSVRVYPSGPGTIIVNLEDDGGTSLISTSFNYGGTGSDTTLALEWYIEPGLDYLITATGTSLAGGAGLYRNISGVDYPYVLEDVVTIKSNAIGQTIVYDFFYDWEVEVLGCPSGRIPASAVLLPPISVNLGFDGVECEGYELDASNPAAISYIWNDDTAINTPMFTVDTSGVYMVEVENSSGCTDRDTVVIFITDTPIASATMDSSACDSLMMTVDSVAGATYFWLGPNPTNQDRFQTNFTAFQSGNYFVTVTKDGCTARDTIVIDILPNPPVDLGPDQSSCDVISLDAGTGAMFAWSTGDNTQSIDLLPPLSGVDTISVVVTNADGCVGADTVLVQQANPPMVNLGLDRSICGTETLDAGNPGSTYDWNTGDLGQRIVVDSTGTYAVVVSDANGCAGTDTVDITVTPDPVADASANLNTGSSTVNFVNTSTPDSLTYMWTFGDGVGTSTDKNPTYTYPTGGSYPVTLVVTNDCGSDTIQFLVENVPTSLDENIFQQGLSLFPNPSEGSFTLEAESLPADEFQIEVTDASGRSVWQLQLSHGGGSFRQFIDLGNAAEGIYLVRVTGQHQQGMQRIQVR
ncbi:MAG: T9SS type A sorting domain-containing protein, partial [Bacteroidota bacterium]